MRRLSLLLAALVGLACPPAAQAIGDGPPPGDASYVGSLIVTAASTECTAGGVAVGDRGLSVFRDTNPAFNDQASLTLIEARASTAYTSQSDEGSFPTTGTFFVARADDRDGFNMSLLGSLQEATFNVTLTRSGPFIALVGSIANWNGIADCDVEVRGGYALQPDEP